MVDPLAEIVTLLQPRAPFSKRVGGAGSWRIRRTEPGRPFYCAILDGSCRLEIGGQPPLALEAGDFVLVPSVNDFAMSSHDPMAAAARDSVPAIRRDGTFRLGTPDGPPDVRLLVGYCNFGSPDAALLVPLLPRLVLVRGEERLATLVALVGDEARAMRPARDVVLARLLEVLLIEALRSTAGTAASPGLLRGLADDRLAAAIRRLHEAPARPWTIAQLAREAALSRSAFFERFNRAVGMAPMEYLLAWRMALARNLLRQKTGSIAQVAQRVGYGSASAFSVAFARHVGMPPSRYAEARTKTGTEAAAA